MQKIVPFLWFDHEAEDAAEFYVSLFRNSKIVNISYYTEGSPMPSGTVMTVSFLLADQEFVALNGGPAFKFTQAISFYVKAKTQKEIDTLWEKLSAGGEGQQCGWLRDKYGMSWQIVPPILGKLLADKNRDKAQSVMRAMLKMRKIDINSLKKAYAGV